MTSAKRIAVIGAGIAGNGAAWALHHGSDHAITLFERETRAGGHSATVDIEYDGRYFAVDTGFIVFNDLNYPNLTRLFEHLGVETFESDMTFSVSDETGRVAWSSRPQDYLGGRFPGAARLPSPVHLQVLGDLVRFNRAGVADLHAGRLRGLTLGEYLQKGGFSRRFREDYLIAMGSAIWSMPPGSVLDFPAEAFLSFFENHRLLRMSQPTWRTVRGGSRSYVEAMTHGFADRLHLGSPVQRVIPGEDGARIVLEDGRVEDFDAVVLGCHSDQALALLGEDAGPRGPILSRIAYRANPVYLHSDPSLMPARKSAWAAWNVIKRHDHDVSVSYWMNALQGIDPACPLFVTLNPARPPAPEHTFARFDYAHPQFDRAALAAQSRLPTIQGLDGIWFCGAWTGYGFHEDGLLSGLSVAEALGATIPWQLTPRQFEAAAE